MTNTSNTWDVRSSIVARAEGIISLNTESSVPVLGFEQRPSYWFTAHADLIRPGVRVLDVACGTGRHALAAAQAGGKVVAVDHDKGKLQRGQAEAARRGLAIEWIEADLTRPWPNIGTFDVVMVFNYLDRQRMNNIVDRIRPGGALMLESYLEIQRELGWGPRSPDHLIKFGELPDLVAPLVVWFGREAFEPADDTRWAAVGSVLARKAK